MKLRLPLLLFVGVAGLPAMAAPPLVRNPYPIRVDGNPGLLVKGDFAGDAADDLVVVQRLFAIQTAINVAGGPFAPVVATTIGNEDINAAAPGHFDADGFLDLAVVLGPSSKVGIYHGNGDGTFRRGAMVSSATYGTSVGQSIAVADFNDDGDADVAVANDSNSGVSVHLGDGNGNLGTGIVTALSDSPMHLLTADFNGDGKADLVLSDYNSTTVALGLGDGRFSATFTKSGGSGAVTGDFDGDTKLDLFVAADHLGAFHLHRGAGDGTFLAPATYRLVRDPGAHRLEAADVDGDGNLDVLGAAPGGVLGVLRGNGDGTLDAPEYWLTDSLGRFFTGDFDRNGTSDVLYMHVRDIHDGGWLYLLPGTGGGAFDGHRAYNAVSPSVLATYVAGLASGDMNGDGKPDVVTTTGSSSFDTRELTVFLNDGAGNFGAPLVTQLTQTSFGSPQPVIGDVNGDGKLDVVVTSATHLGNGDGTFQAPVPITPTPGSGRTFLADITGEGHPDLITAWGSQSYETYIYHGSGTGSFSRVASLPLRVDVVADFNEDGRPDIAGRSYSDTATQVGLNNGSGGFVLSDADPMHINTVASAGDFNGDGHADLLLANGNDSLRVTFGRGNGTFGDPVYLVTNFSLWGAFNHTADIDGDGALDVIRGGSMLLGDGTGRFRSYASVRGAGGLHAIADFDSDGDLDLVVNTGAFVSLVRPRVGPDPPLATSMTLTADPAAPRYGDSVTHEGVLSRPTAQGNGGAIVLSVDGVRQRLQVLAGGYWLTDHFRTFPTGTHSVTMAYTGDTHHAPVSQTLVHEVARGYTEISGPVLPRACAAEIHIWMVVEHRNTDPNQPYPTGGLTFRVGNSVLPSRELPDFGGYAVSGLGVGTHTVIAEYAGDANYAPASRTFTQVVNPPYNASLSAGSAVYRNETGNIAGIAGNVDGATVTWSIANGTIESGQGTPRIVYTAGASGAVTLQATIVPQGGGACSMVVNATVAIIERPAGASMLYTVGPCRLLDTRGGAPQGAVDTSLLVAGNCGVPAGAKSVVANITVIAPAASGWMSFWPAGQPWPATSTINYRAGKTRANNSIVPLSPDGRIHVRSSGPNVHYLIDVYGYFR
ncbi:MAG TPA: FG-GAP-like repeat-containing protein [Thermoanaerobaculia bacterium]|nr:FG-GAP-like repeat-containing protein [Thermoanaerobaculia bacterium]